MNFFDDSSLLRPVAVTASGCGQLRFIVTAGQRPLACEL
jgi:hypothetical protein